MFECCSLAVIALIGGLLLTRWVQADEEKRQRRQRGSGGNRW